MLSASLLFLVCAAVIVVAGTFLTRFADALADLTGLGRLVIGSVLLAGATSLPELTVDVSAIRMGMPDLAVGDLLGSSLFNLLILAALDLSNYSRGKLLSKQGAAHAMSGSVSAALTALVGLGLLTGKALAEYAIFGVSPVILLIAIAYAFGIRLIYLDQRIAARGDHEHQPQEMPLPPGMTLSKALIGFAICAVVIFIAGPFMAHAAGQLADLTGLGKSFVGTTLVALSTSLPELVSMIAALRMGAMDLAIGNVYGSNAFNMILLVPLDFLHATPLFADVSPNHAVTCMATILATLVAIMGQLYRVELRRSFIEPDAWLVIVIVIGALAAIYYLPAEGGMHGQDAAPADQPPAAQAGAAGLSRPLTYAASPPTLTADFPFHVLQQGNEEYALFTFGPCRNCHWKQHRPGESDRPGAGEGRRQSPRQLCQQSGAGRADA